MLQRVDQHYAFLLARAAFDVWRRERAERRRVKELVQVGRKVTAVARLRYYLFEWRRYVEWRKARKARIRKVAEVLRVGFLRALFYVSSRLFFFLNA
jgi:hypothetical protein